MMLPLPAPCGATTGPGSSALNIAVVTGSAPTKGIPLPFLTFGGSGLCVTLAQVGILLSIDRANGAEAAGAAGERPPEEGAP